jgi:hypothetical protein
MECQKHTKNKYGQQKFGPTKSFKVQGVIEPGLYVL